MIYRDNASRSLQPYGDRGGKPHAEPSTRAHLGRMILSKVKRVPVMLSKQDLDCMILKSSSPGNNFDSNHYARKMDKGDHSSTVCQDNADGSCVNPKAPQTGSAKTKMFTRVKRKIVRLDPESIDLERTKFMPLASSTVVNAGHASTTATPQTAPAQSQHTSSVHQRNTPTTSPILYQVERRPVLLTLKPNKHESESETSIFSTNVAHVPSIEKAHHKASIQGDHRLRQLDLPALYNLNRIILNHAHVTVALLDRDGGGSSTGGKDVRNGNGNKAVLKEIYLSETNDVRLRNAALCERIAHQKVGHHKNICSCMSAYITPKGDMCMLLRYAPGGNVLQLIRNSKEGFGIEQVKQYVAQILKGLNHIHNKRVAHRDIKPENLVISEDGEIMITDFGLAARGCSWAAGGDGSTCCGTPIYMSPEIASQQIHGLSTDMWSLGVLLFEMLVGKPPYNKANFTCKPIQIISKLRTPIESWDYDFYRLPPRFRDYGHLDDFLRRLLQPKPELRITAAGALRHPFMKLSDHDRHVIPN